MSRRHPFEIGDQSVDPGERRSVDLPISMLSDHTPMNMTVEVFHGLTDGPVLFLSAAIHGDEVLGVEIIRRILRHRSLLKIRGTLLAAPVVNSYGFISHSRYLPDGRDLNRSFPGSEKGSLASQLADLFMNEIVLRSDVGIDLHTAGRHRSNLPQIRLSARRGRSFQLAKVFGAPVVLISRLREGTLRSAARDHGIDMLLYEAGEALRFDEMAIRAGVMGVLRVMEHLGMITSRHVKPSAAQSAISLSSHWIRATDGGVFRAYRKTGDTVVAGEGLGVIADPFGTSETEVISTWSGIVIGRTNLPVVNRGDALYHVAEVSDADALEDTIESLESELESAPLFDEDEIL